MRFSETALVFAVRTVLRLPVDQHGGGFKANECQAEHDEMAPATVGDRYVVVMPAGFRAGPRHNTSGGVYDLIYSVDVAVIRRATSIPRDRKRDLIFGSQYLSGLDSLNEDVDRVITAIDFDLTSLVNRTANTLITQETGSAEGFIESLKLAGIEKRPRIVGGEVFGSSGDSAGLARVISFSGARRITTRA